MTGPVCAPSPAPRPSRRGALRFFAVLALAACGWTFALAPASRPVPAFPQTPCSGQEESACSISTARSRCSCRRARSITTTRTSALPPSATSRSTTAAPRSRPTRSSTTRPPSACMPKATSASPTRRARSPTARSWICRTITATASSNSLRLDTPDQTRMAAARAERSQGNYTVFHNGVYTACEPCKDDPKKPPLWQVKAARIIHDQKEHMIYFEDASLEFFGKPLAWLPYFSAPDPTVKRKTGFLMPSLTVELDLRRRRRSSVLLGDGAELRRRPSRRRSPPSRAC